MDESMTDEGRRQSILKQRNRFPLQEVQGFFGDDDTVTTTLTRSRRVSFGRNLVKEFIVGSAVSTQAVHEYEQSSESLSDPSECSGPLDLALDKTGRDAKPEVDRVSMCPPEPVNETKPSDPEKRVRTFTENCISIAKSVFHDTETELTAIIIGAKPSSMDDERKNSSCMSFTTMDVSHMQGADHWHRGSQPDFGPVRHPEQLFNNDCSYQIDKSRFEFLDSSIANAALSGGKVARQGSRKPLAPLSHISPWDGENDENIPPAHAFHASPRDKTETWTAGGSHSDMEETCRRPLHNDADLTRANLSWDAGDNSSGEESDVDDPLRLDATRDDFINDLSGLDGQAPSGHVPSDTEDSFFGGLQKELANLSVGNQSFRERLQTLPGKLNKSTDGGNRPVLERNQSPPPSVTVESPLAQFLSPPKCEISFLNTSATCNEIKYDTACPTAGDVAVAPGDDSMEMTGVNIPSWRATAVCGEAEMELTEANIAGWQPATDETDPLAPDGSLIAENSLFSSDKTLSHESPSKASVFLKDQFVSEISESNLANEPDPLTPGGFLSENSVFSQDAAVTPESLPDASVVAATKSGTEISEPDMTADEPDPLTPGGFLSENSVFSQGAAVTPESLSEASVVAPTKSGTEISEPNMTADEPDPLTPGDFLPILENSMFSQDSSTSEAKSVAVEISPRPYSDLITGNKVTVGSASTSTAKEEICNGEFSEAPVVLNKNPLNASDGAMSPKTVELPMSSTAGNLDELLNERSQLHYSGNQSPVLIKEANTSAVCPATPTPANHTGNEMELTEANICFAKDCQVTENNFLEELKPVQPNGEQTVMLEGYDKKPEPHDVLVLSDTTKEMILPLLDPTVPNHHVGVLTCVSVNEEAPAPPKTTEDALLAPTTVNFEATEAPNITIEVPVPIELPLNTPLAGLAALSKRPSLRERLLAAPPDSTTASICLERSTDVTEGTMGGLVPCLMKTMSEERHMRAIHESTRVVESPLHNVDAKVGEEIQQDLTYNVQPRQCEDTYTVKVVNENTFTLNKIIHEGEGEGTHAMNKSVENDMIAATKRTHSDSPCPEERFKKNRPSNSPKRLDMSNFAREILQDMEATLSSSEQPLGNVGAVQKVLEESESVGKRIHSDSPLPTDRMLKKHRHSASPLVKRSLGLVAVDHFAERDVSYCGPARFSTDLDSSVTLDDVTLSATLPVDESLLREAASFAVFPLSPAGRSLAAAELETSRTLVSDAFIPVSSTNNTMAREISMTIPNVVVPELEEEDCEEAEEIANAEVSSTTFGDLPSDDRVPEELTPDLTIVNPSSDAPAPMDVDCENPVTEQPAVDALHEETDDDLTPGDAGSSDQDTSHGILEGELNCLRRCSESVVTSHSLSESLSFEQLLTPTNRTATNKPIPPDSSRQELSSSGTWDQICRNVEKELNEQAREDSCLWKLRAFDRCQIRAEGAVEVELPLLDTALLLAIRFQSEGGSVLVKTIQTQHRPATRYQSSVKTLVNDFGYDTLKNFITREEKKMLKLEEVPYFLDFFNAFTRKLVEAMEDLLTVLRGCAGSRLSGHVLSIRLHSFSPALFSCWVDLDLNELLMLGQAGSSFRHELGRMDETAVRCLLQNTQQPHLQSFIRSAVNQIIRQEAVTGFVTRRPELRF